MEELFLACNHLLDQRLVTPLVALAAPTQLEVEALTFKLAHRVIGPVIDDADVEPVGNVTKRAAAAPPWSRARQGA